MATLLARLGRASFRHRRLVASVWGGLLAVVIALLATVGGALGAGLEDDDVVRAAAYTRSST